LAAAFTAFYSLRLLYLTFLSNPHSSQSSYQDSHESPWQMTLPLFILSIGSIFVGYLLRDMYIGLGSSFFGNSIWVLPQNYLMVEAEFISDTYIKWIPVILSILGASFAIFFLHFTPQFLISLKNTYLGKETYKFLSNKW
jgi:NADH-ubiquinone oxidoreductase chain 5